MLLLRVAPSGCKAKGAHGDAAKYEATKISKGKVRNNIFLGNRKISRLYKEKWRKVMRLQMLALLK